MYTSTQPADEGMPPTPNHSLLTKTTAEQIIHSALPELKKTAREDC